MAIITVFSLHANLKGKVHAMVKLRNKSCLDYAMKLHVATPKYDIVLVAGGVTWEYCAP